MSDIRYPISIKLNNYTDMQRKVSITETHHKSISNTKQFKKKVTFYESHPFIGNRILQKFRFTSTFPSRTKRTELQISHIWEQINFRNNNFGAQREIRVSGLRE